MQPKDDHQWDGPAPAIQVDKEELLSRLKDQGTYIIPRFREDFEKKFVEINADRELLVTQVRSCLEKERVRYLKICRAIGCNPENYDKALDQLIQLANKESTK